MSTDRSNRGQTAIDFVTAIALFLLAVAFALAFVPSMFAPFFGMGSADALTADRSAAYLAENKLAEDPRNPGALSQDDVIEFFDACDGGDWLAHELGTGTANVQVQVDGVDGSPCGEAPSDADTVSIRVVTVDGDQRTLRVVVW